MNACTKSLSSLLFGFFNSSIQSFSFDTYNMFSSLSFFQQEKRVTCCCRFCFVSVHFYMLHKYGQECICFFLLSQLIKRGQNQETEKGFKRTSRETKKGKACTMFQICSWLSAHRDLDWQFLKRLRAQLRQDFFLTEQEREKRRTRRRKEISQGLRKEKKRGKNLQNFF